MSRHVASVSWRAEGDFRAGKYSRRHRIGFDGGATLLASASPDVVPAPFSDPTGADPEELLVAALASCHMLWFLDLAHRAGLDVAAYRDEAVGEMGRAGPGRMAVTRITLNPEIVYAGEPPDPAQAEALHDAAHQRCFIANTLNCEIVVAPAAR
jgi:organic hydroperoxide reductase OsmC/OhrA